MSLRFIDAQTILETVKTTIQHNVELLDYYQSDLAAYPMIKNLGIESESALISKLTSTPTSTTDLTSGEISCSGTQLAHSNLLKGKDLIEYFPWDMPIKSQFRPVVSMIENITQSTTGQAVVRIKAQKCDIVNCIDSSISSGALIHPHGIILTTWHTTVIDRQDKLSSHLDRFVIEMPDNPGGILKPKYRAELIADLPEQDLAFLQITADETGKSVTPVDLPFLPINAQKLESDNKLLILGYSNPFIQNSSPTWHRIDKIVSNDIALEALDSLQPGYSGGPALINDQGELKVVGVVSSLDPNSAQLVHVQGLSELKQLRWATDSDLVWKKSQVWCKKMQILSLDVKGVPTLRIMMDLYAINFVGQTGRLVAYAYDTKTHQPLKVTDSRLPQAPDGQLALYHDFYGQHYLDKFDLPIEIPQKALNLQIPLDGIQFRLMFVGNDGQRLWEGEKWYNVTIINPIPMATVNIISPSATPTPSSTPTSPPPPIPSGRIAFPVLNKGTIDISIYCFSINNICQRLPAMRHPDFSGGGHLLVNSERSELNSLIRMSPDYTNQRLISRHWEDAHPQWSPSGESFVFDSISQAGNYHVYWQQDASERPTEETPPIAYGSKGLLGRYPIYLVNERIAYQGCDTWKANSNCGIYTVKDTGEEEPRQVTNKTNDIPNDNLLDDILFMSDQANNWDIYRVNSNNPVRIQRLTSSPGCDGLATASPDGQFIAFMTNREETWAVYVMRPDGSEQHKLFDVESTGFGCGDGKWLDERMSWGPP